MQLIDTHCHLFLEEFDNDRNEIVNKSKEAGVIKIINPNIDAFTIQSLFNTCESNPEICLPALGLHPCSVKEDYKSQLTIIKDYLKKHIPVAIGEIGIDLYWDKTFIEQQKKALEEQLHWAVDYNLPVIIHNRDAFEHVLKIVQKFQTLKGVFHAYSGTPEQALHVLTTKFYFGIGGVVTFKNAGLDKIVTELPLERIVLETDAPYLTPVPHRGERNDPSYLALIVAKIAEVKNITIEEVASVTTLNAKHLFGI